MRDQLTNETLMTRFAQGDMQAFEVLYERNKGPLFRFFLRQRIQTHVAEELAQDVWMNIIRRREGYHSSALFTTYLYQIARNRLIDYLRKAGNSPEQTDADNKYINVTPSHGSPEQVFEQQRQLSMFVEAVERLPMEQREAFLLKEEGGLSIAQIAEVVGVNEETVKSRYRYAVAKLKQCLLEHGIAYA